MPPDATQGPPSPPTTTSLLRVVLLLLSVYLWLAKRSAAGCGKEEETRLDCLQCSQQLPRRRTTSRGVAVSASPSRTANKTEEESE